MLCKGEPMKKTTLMFLLLAALLFPVSSAVYADSCGASFDHSGACGRNCMSANPDCGLRGWMGLCGGTGVTTTSETTAGAAGGAQPLAGAAAGPLGVNGEAFRGAADRGELNRGEVNRAGT